MGGASPLMQRQPLSVSVKWLMVVVAAIALILGFDSAFLRPIRDHQRWFYRVRTDLESLTHRRPPDVDRETWGYVVGWTLNAHGNCCSAPTYVDPGRTKQFAEELEQRLQGKVGMDTIDWIWDEFMRFSKIKSYDRFRPTTPEHLKEAAGTSWLGLVVE